MSAPPAAAAAPPQTPAATTFTAAPNKLTAEQLQAIYTKAHREGGTTFDGNPWQISYEPDGTINLSSGNFTDTGHGVIKGDAICSTYTKLWKGQEHCFHYAKVDDAHYASYESDGSLSSVFSIWGM